MAAETIVSEVGREPRTSSRDVARLLERLSEAESSIAKISYNQKTQTNLLNDFDKQRDKNEIRLHQLETELKTCRDISNSNKNVADSMQRRMKALTRTVTQIRGESRKNKIKESERFERLERRIQGLEMTGTLPARNIIAPIEMGLKRLESSLFSKLVMISFS